jgi:aspartate aminotransferase-like enzyme
VIEVKVPDGSVVEPAKIKQLLDENKDTKAVFTTQCETSTGAVTDIEAIGNIVSATNAVLVVDAISSLGAEDLQTDNWHVDCVVSGSQKGMMLPPGLAFCSVSEKAMNAAKNSKSPKYYFDFKKAKKAVEKTDTPFTPAISLILSGNVSLRLIREQGLEKIFARNKVLAEATRAAVTALGLKLFSKTFCRVLTATEAPVGIAASQIVKIMRDKYGVSIAEGQGEALKDKIIRIAHLGYIQTFDVITAISALELALTELGYKLELGKGVQAAEKVFAASAC